MKTSFILKNLFIILFISSFIFMFSFNVNASEKSEDILIETQKDNIDINDNFDETSVIVLLDSEVSGINKNHNSTLFKNIGYSKITDLTYVNDVNTLNDINAFEQILKIELINPGKENVINMINQLSLIPGIKYVGANRRLTVDVVPNDPFYSSNVSEIDSQWAHRNIDSELAWDFSTGTSKVRVGVIDSGVSNHFDLKDNLTTGYDFTKMVNNEPGELREDKSGHGTHVAGIIGAAGNQIFPMGIAGVNWDVSIVPMQVGLDNETVDLDSCINAVTYATRLWDTNKRISILNMCISIYDEWPLMESAIRQFKGLFVCSTGNEEQDNDLNGQYNYPSFYGSTLYHNPLSNMISVGRIDITNNRPVNKDANWGAHTISIYAPGQNILSTYPELKCLKYNGVFSDGTRMCELDPYIRNVIYGYVDSGEYSLDYILNNFNLIFGEERSPSKYVISHHHSNGYHYMSGSSMSTPYVSGVAALLLSLNKELTAIQLKQAILESAEEITITVPDTSENAKEDDTVEQDVLKLNAYNAVKYVLENYMNSATYTLSNYSNTIDTSKTITSDASYFDELNGFYKLNVTYTKNYEFISTSTSGIEVTLYDDNFTEVTYSNLDSTSNTVHFIEKLNVGTYYLRVAYENEDSTGTINTEIISRNTVYLSSGVNDILINTYNEISEYFYTHNQGPGFYKFKLTAGNITSYPSGAIKVYKDQSRTELLDRFETDMISYSSSSNTNENEIYVYLPCNGIYYIDILLNNVNYSSVTMEIEEVELNEPNYSSTLSSSAFNVVFENINKYSYFEKIIVDALSKIQIDVIARGTLNDYVPILLFKEEIDYESPINNREYYLDTIFIGEVNPIEYIPCYTFILEPGTYYIGYIDNTDKVFMNIALTRLVEYSDNMDSILVADPYYTGYDLGTEVLFNNGECNTYTITEGFTRNIYLMVEDRLRDPMSRLEYEWYSSNESVATVSSYGTVLARKVEIDTTVKIFAVLKEDPSIVYFKEFTILNDEEEELIEIELDMSYSYSAENGTYQLELTNTNCPYPMIQYYYWNIVNENEGTVSINSWGQVTATSPCSCVIIGTYKLNPRVKIIINLSII